MRQGQAVRAHNRGPEGDVGVVLVVAPGEGLVQVHFPRPGQTVWTSADGLDHYRARVLTSPDGRCTSTYLDQYRVVVTVSSLRPEDPMVEKFKTLEELDQNFKAQKDAQLRVFRGENI